MAGQGSWKLTGVDPRARATARAAAEREGITIGEWLSRQLLEDPDDKIAARAARRGAEEARAQLPELLAAAERGQTTVITKYGRPIAAIVPIDQVVGKETPQQSILPLIGSGKGMWGEDSRQFIRELRDEWDR
jgi:prevent-host-death family protein